ncbi:hypothetical protein B0F90DRAFT_1668511 [Multifurca ochricompacta]|uniref:Uncharacterized protein n=1 Tax=Multifurca ochricompacta TaxID=376703 RepID=A0AAD4M2Z5_9AGAM|nr:hypothetical protein B0F90DRAFT_1668511 [Multifurca ochricompacta]
MAKAVHSAEYTLTRKGGTPKYAVLAAKAYKRDEVGLRVRMATLLTPLTSTMLSFWLLVSYVSSGSIPQILQHLTTSSQPIWLFPSVARYGSIIEQVQSLWSTQTYHFEVFLAFNRVGRKVMNAEACLPDLRLGALRLPQPSDLSLAFELDDVVDPTAGLITGRDQY